MYLFKLKIQNFRGIKNLEWKPNKTLNVIIGKNGSGKSNLGTALDYLLNPYRQWYNKKLNSSDFYNRDTDNKIIIEAWFKELDDFIEEDNDLLLQHISEDKIDEDGDELALIFRFEANGNSDYGHYIYSDGKLKPLYQKHKGLINFKYVTDNRNPEKELSLYSNSLLSKMIQDDSVDESVIKIIEKFKDYATEELLENSHFSNILKKIGASFFEFNMIKDINNSLSIEPTQLTETKALSTFSLLLGNVGNEEKIPLEYQSKGYKNLMLLLLLRFELEKKGIIFIEEPEQNLEPQLQRKIISKYRKTVQGQLFVTSHSISIVEKFEFNEIFIMKNNEIYEVPNPSSVNKTLSKRFEKYDKKDVIEGLFANNVLIVEGDSEYGGFPIFSSYSPNGFDNMGTKVIKADGKGSTKYYGEFFAKFKKPVICLYDNDEDIEDTLSAFKDIGLDITIIKQKKDYEALLLESKIFKDNWISIFEKNMPFSEFKDNYFAPFEHKKSKSKRLKNKKSNYTSRKDFASVNDIIADLSNDLIDDYITEILHLKLSGILESKAIAIDICTHDDRACFNPVPDSLMQLLKVNSIVATHGGNCDNKCIIYNEDEKSCTECFSEYDYHKKIFTLKGDSK